MKLAIAAAAATILASTGLAAAEPNRTVISNGQTLTVQRGGEPVLRGSGAVVRQTRAIAPFSAVLADDGANVEVVLGATRSLEVVAEDNLIGRVTTSVVDGRLRVGVIGSYLTRTPPVVRVVTPSLAEVVLRTSSNARLDGLGGGPLRLESNGSGDFAGRGRLESVSIKLNGSGRADLADVAVEDADVAVNGSGAAVVRVSGALTAAVNGNGTVTYLGDPARVRTSANGTGVIVRAAP